MKIRTHAFGFLAKGSQAAVLVALVASAFGANSASAKLVELVRLKGELDAGKVAEYRLSLDTDEQDSIRAVQLHKMKGAEPDPKAKPTSTAYEDFISPTGAAMLTMPVPLIGDVQVIVAKVDFGFAPDKGGNLTIKYLQDFFGGKDNDKDPADRKHQNLTFHLGKVDDKWVLATDPAQDHKEKIDRIADKRKDKTPVSGFPAEYGNSVPVKKIEFEARVWHFGKRTGIKSWTIIE